MIIIKIDGIAPVESLLLCKLSKQPIGELPINCITSEKKSIDETYEIELKVNKYLVSQNEKRKIENPLYYEVKNKRYILINDEDYYIIDNVKESKISGVKTATCYSGEQILARRPINIEDIGIQILDDDIENDVYSLDTLLSEVGWKLGYVDETIVYEEVESANKMPKLRWQESINNNMLDFIKEEIAMQFDCLPTFDAKTRTVNLYDMNTLGEEIQLCLTKDNYLKSKEKTNTSDDLITVLKLKGAEELDVARYIVGGYDFITDFSYFIETREMSDELISTLAKYDEMVAIRHSQWLALVDEKAEKESELNIKRNQWIISISTIECHKRVISNYVLSGDKVHESETKVELAKEIDNELILRLQIEDLLKEIDLLQENIDNINLLCKYETCTDENGNLIFNQDTLNELQEFIFVDVYNDDSFVDPYALIEKGRSVLSEKCKPTISISIDSVNFMSRIIDNNFRLKWNGELNFGDIIILIDEDTNQEEFYYFTGYNINYENNSLELKISNKKSNRDNARTINQWLKETKKLKSLLTTNKYIFNQVKQNRLNINKDDIQ